MLFNIFESRLIIKGTIIATRPIHIGVSQDSIDPVQVDSPVLKDSKGMPVIPGASLKGVLRSYLEAILANPAFKSKFRSCNILDDSDSCYEQIRKHKDYERLKREIKSSYSNMIQNQKNKELSEMVYSESCDVCRLFGNGHFGAKLQVKDMCYIGDKVDYERRDGVSIDRETGTAKERAKYGYQITPADTKFDFYMIADNLEDKQKALVELLIKMLKEGEISVGGMVSRGLGQIKLVDEYREIIDKDSILKHYGLEGVNS